MYRFSMMLVFFVSIATVINLAQCSCVDDGGNTRTPMVTWNKDDCNTCICIPWYAVKIVCTTKLCKKDIPELPEPEELVETWRPKTGEGLREGTTRTNRFDHDFLP